MRDFGGNPDARGKTPAHLAAHVVRWTKGTRAGREDSEQAKQAKDKPNE